MPLLLFNEASIGIRGKLKLTITDAITGKVLRVDEGPNMVLNTGIEDICHLLAGDTTVPADLLAGQNLYQSSMAIPRIPLYGQFGISSIAPASTDASKFSNGTLDSNASSPSPSVASDIIKSIAYFPVTLVQGQSPSDGSLTGGGTDPNSTGTDPSSTGTGSGTITSSPPTGTGSGSDITRGGTFTPPSTGSGGSITGSGEQGQGQGRDPRPVQVSNSSYINNQVTVQFTLLPNQGNGIGGTDTTYREVVLMSKIVDNPVQYRWFARRVFGDIIKNPTTIITAEWTFTFIIVRPTS